jgi:hypothetical protein
MRIISRTTRLVVNLTGRTIIVIKRTTQWDTRVWWSRKRSSYQNRSALWRDAESHQRRFDWRRLLGKTRGPSDLATRDTQRGYTAVVQTRLEFERMWRKKERRKKKVSLFREMITQVITMPAGSFWAPSSIQHYFWQGAMNIVRGSLWGPAVTFFTWTKKTREKSFSRPQWVFIIRSCDFTLLSEPARTRTSSRFPVSHLSSNLEIRKTCEKNREIVAWGFLVTDKFLTR